MPFANSALVAVAAPVRNYFSYGVPPEWAPDPQLGQLVEVPFGRGRKRGVIIALDQAPPDGVELKPLLSVVEPAPLFSARMLSTLRWATDYYMVPPGEMIFAGLPPVFRKVGARAQPKRLMLAELVRLPGPEDANRLAQRAPRQSDLLAKLALASPQPVSALAADSTGARAALRGLEKKGLVRLFQLEQPRTPPPVDLPGGEAVPEPTEEQGLALERIFAAMDAGRYEAFLLHGVTGSGKTEVYLRAIERALAAGRGAILLVPEISLTPQLMKRVSLRFGAQVAVLHSGLGQGERLDEWRRLQCGQARVAVGARSAVFAPVRDPGVLIVDEEHDSSYKQSERLPYSGRDLAMVRAREEGAVVVLGSATPSLESWAHAREARSGLLTLAKRVQSRPLPDMEIIDLKRVLDPLERDHTLSPPLADALAETLDRGEQAILFLNRRGYSSFALCKSCGEAVRCRNCSVALVHHLAGEELRCHYCGLVTRVPATCPECGQGRVQLFGLGTEKCEHEVRRRFPGARVLRLDSDSIATKGALADTMGRFARAEADVLVGTQMVTKGHDLPGVTLVGVVLADLGIHLPDFRAAERTFQILTQVAGRAGRGDKPGRVLVQTFLPQHESIRMAQERQLEAFYDQELRRRQALGYPPSRRLLMVRFSHPDVSVTQDLARAAAQSIRREGGDRVVVLGPVASPLARLRGRYRWQLMVKCTRIEDLHRVASAARGKLRAPSGAKILFDVDPVDML